MTNLTNTQRYSLEKHNPSTSKDSSLKNLHINFRPHIIVIKFILSFFSIQLIFLQKLIAAASETILYYIIGKLLSKAWNSNVN